MKRLLFVYLCCFLSATSFAQDSVTFVDLGLSVDWAACNIGATGPEDFGNFYAWGEMSPKESYSWGTYRFGTYEKGMNAYNPTDKVYVLKLEDDIAAVTCGEGCRLPTRKECEELMNKCEWNYATVNGIKGYKVVGPNGNHIFLPLAGYYINKGKGYSENIGAYWTSDVCVKEPHCAYYLSAYLSGPDMSCFNRSHGRSVRAVREK
jgi:uncharacterized protein (TIGR02145 family)